MKFLAVLLLLCVPACAQITTLPNNCRVYPRTWMDITIPTPGNYKFQLNEDNSLSNGGWLAIGLSDPNITFGNWGCTLHSSGDVIIVPFPTGAGSVTYPIPAGWTAYAQAGWDFTGVLYLGQGFKIKT